MQIETIEIVTTKDRFFKEYLILKKPIIDSILTKLNKKKTTLSDMPLRVLAQLLYYNNMYIALPEEQKWSNVFSKETKDKICTSLEMKEHHLNIYISQLRTIKILEGKTIRKIFIVYINDNRSLNFTFKLNGHTL
jgi:hypothetical protein